MNSTRKAMLYSMLILASAFLGMAIFDDSEDVDAATASYRAIDLYNNNGSTYTLDVGTIVSISDTIISSSTDSGFYSNKSSLTVTTSTQSVTITNLNGGQQAGTATVYFVGSSTPTPTTYKVSFYASPSSYGSVSTTSITVDSGTTYSASGRTITFSDGQSVTATPASSTSSYSYSFRSWSSTSGTITSGKTIYADFDRTSLITYYSHTLYFNANGGTGAPSTMSHTTTSYTSYTFTIPSTEPTRSGYSFMGWSTSSTATSPSYQPGDTISVGADSSRTLYAVWTNTLQVFVESAGNGTVTGAGTYQLDDQFTLTATANTGYVFDYWTFTVDGGSESSTSLKNPYTATVTSIMLGHYTTYTAHFKVATFTVSLNVNNSSFGSVSPTAITDVPYNTTITVSGNTLTIGSTTATATPAQAAGYVYTFDSWSGIPSTNRIIANTTITANFASSLGTVTVYTDTDGNGTVTGAGTYQLYDQFTLTATPNEGYVFDRWTFTVDGGSESSTSLKNPYTATVTSIMTGHYTTYTAHFTAIPTVHVIVESDGNGTVTGGGYFRLDDQFTLTATPNEGYVFDYWTFTVDGGSESSTSLKNPYTATVTSIMLGHYTTYTAHFTAIPTVQVIVETDGNGTAVGGGYFRLDDQFTLTATANTGYVFDYWTFTVDGGSESSTSLKNPYTATVTSIMLGHYTTYTAHFRPYTDTVYWSNDNYNGTVNMLFQFGSDAKTHVIDVPLYTGSVEDSITTWTKTDYRLSVVLSYPQLRVTSTLLIDDVAQDTKSKNLGSWNTFMLSINTDAGTVEITPVKTFMSFTDYTLYEKRTTVVMDFSTSIKGAASYEIMHSEAGQGESPRFSVVSTSVFLNTYGVVLFNPTINLYDYFPQFDAIRVNFYSFALYGDSITINGTTFPVDGSKITIRYVSSGDQHYLPDVMPNETVQTRSFELSNIYVTYEDGHAYLTFVNDRFTLDMGPYSAGDQVISMAGIWYFTTMVYEPYEATEKHLSDWKVLPELSSAQMLLMFIAILIVAGSLVAIHARRSGLGWVDVVIIALAALVAFILLG